MTTWLRATVLVLLAAQGALVAVSCLDGSSQGEAGSSCDGTLGLGGECGICATPLADHCRDHDCTMPDVSRICFERPTGFRALHGGCGYVEVRSHAGSILDDMQVSIVDVWHEESGELVFHSESYSADSCQPALEVGEDPVCGRELLCHSGDCGFPPFIDCLGLCLPQGCKSCQDLVEGKCDGSGQGGQGGFGGEAP